MIILNTNVISELMEARPHQAVIKWAQKQRPDQLVTTSISVMELRAGVERLKPGRRQRYLADSVEWVLSELLQNRILTFDRKAAYATAAWHAHLRRSGRTIQLSDAQIAGIAVSRRIPIAVRDIGDFEGLDVKLIDPWSTR